MEKLQLCLDEADYDFPTSNANIDLGAGSSPAQSQNARTAESDVIFKSKASACELGLPPRYRDQSMLYNHSCYEQSFTGAFESVTNAEVPWNPKHNWVDDMAGHKVETSSSSQGTTKLSMQEVEKAKSSSAQDVFWASVLQAQLCVLELQDELEKKAVLPEISPCEPTISHLDHDSSVEVQPNHIVDDVLYESQENEESCPSDGEIEEEHLFCDNPLFNSAHSSCPVVADLQPIYALRTNAKDFVPLNEGSDQREVVPHDHPAQNELQLWDQKEECRGTCFGHEMKHAESLEVLQIFENDLEEKEAMAGRLKAPKWPIYDNLPCTQENVHRPHDETRSSALTPEIDVCEKDISEAEGLLFCHSSSSLVSALLVEQDILQQNCPFPVSTDKPTCPIIQIESLEKEGTCQDEVDPHPLCTGCQGKEHSITLVFEKEEAEELVSSQEQSFSESLKEEADKTSTHSSEEGTYVETVANIDHQDREAARCLALRLFQLDGFQRSQVAPHLQKNNDFSAMVAEEYLSHFEFTGKTLDVALRSLLKELILTGETQERERVLFQFSKRFHSCNPKDFRSADAVHTLTCALMLLNTDLHGQNIGKSMSLQDFIINLDGMNDGDCFSRDLLKGMYNSIRNEKLEWAVGEKLTNALIAKTENPMNRKKSNPFIDIPCPDPQAPIYRQGMLCRKVHADTDGKRTPWGKRGWKPFYTVLKGTVMFFLKDEYRSDIQCPEEIISVHHALAERASEYTKRPHVFRMQTADWRVFLFQAQTLEEMNSWIVRINLVAALFSSPPFPAAIGSQKRFVRPILPSAACKLGLEEQLQSHEIWMDTFTDDLTEHQRNLPDSKSRARDWEDYHLKEEYLRFEKSRYEMYVKLMALRMQNGCDDLGTFETLVIDPSMDQQDGCGLKRSHSSPSLIPENLSMGLRVKRNISERRTYRRIIPKRNKNVI